MSIGKNIKKIREEHNLTQEELGKIVGVTDKAVSTWENETKNPRMGTIQKLSDYFGIPKSSIIEDSVEPNANLLPQTDIRMIPLYESVSAGFGAAAYDCVIDYIPTIMHSSYEAAETIAIIVSGDSMYPKIEDGDKIVVHKQSSVDSGQIAVVLIDGEDAVVKKVKYGKDWVDLISINPEYKTRHFEKEELERLRVLGLVRQIIKNV